MFNQRKGPYIKLNPECKAKVAKCAIEVHSWVAIYKKELEHKRKIGGTVPDVSVLPPSKRGQPLLIGDKLNYQVRAYIRSVREAGGPVTTTIVMSTGRAIVNQHDP